MAQFYKLLMGFLMIGLSAVAIFSFVITIQENNNSTEKILTDSTINETYLALKNKTESFGAQAQNQKEIFEKENPVSTLGSLIFYSVISSGKVFNSMIVQTFNLIINLPVRYLSLDPSIVAIITVMIIATMIIGLWIIYKVGG